MQFYKSEAVNFVTKNAVVSLCMLTGRVLMFIDHVCKGALILSVCCHKSTLLRVLMFIYHICKVETAMMVVESLN